MQTRAEELVSRVTELASPAPTVVRLLGLLNSPDIDSRAVEEVVECDAVLSAKMLSLANSAYFGLARPAESLREVLFYLGNQEVYRMAMAVALSGVLNRKARAYAMDESELWRHLLVTAKYAELLVAAVSSANFDEATAYTSGLVHDIGKIVFNQVLDAPTQSILNETLEHEKKIGTEREVLGTDHCEAGACLLLAWKLPGSIVDAVAMHHVWTPDSGPTLSNMVYLANRLAHALAGQGPADAITFSEAEAIGLEPEALKRIKTSVMERLPRLNGIAALSLR